MDLFSYTDSLTTPETNRLEYCEKIISIGINTFVDVGNALLEIRDNRLYRQGYKTFEEYCRERWGFTDRRARMLMAASEVMENISKTGTIVPVSESQARPLTQLKPEQQREAWQAAVDTAPEGKITAAHVQRVVDEITEKRPHVANNSGDNEWYTPPEYIAAAIEVMGEIDLDPASSEIANKTVGAKIYFTAEDDGLLYSWDGRVWMNPPYAGELIGKFCDKLVQHIESGDVSEAIVLVNNATETWWFNRLISVTASVMFPRGRIRFLDTNGNPGAPLQGQAVIYCGNNPAQFIKTFSKFGWCAEICRQQ